MADSRDPPEKPPSSGRVVKLADEAYRRARGKKTPPPEMPPELDEQLAYNRNGFTACAHNLVLILREHPAWIDGFAFDEFAGVVVKRRNDLPGLSAGPIIESDATAIAAWMSNPSHVGVNAKSSQVREAVDLVARASPFHPVRAYLEGLIWDKTERLPTMFADFWGAEQNDYTGRLATMFLVSAVARIFKPGAVVNFMVVLEGKQQIGKTLSISALFGPEWTCEAMESPLSKDFYQALIGKWAVEIAEMHSFNRAEVPKVKQAITTRIDRYRPSYGRMAVDFPRQCIFCGTTNEDQYLRDATGAARFLPIRVNDIDLPAIRQVRDQLLAEAVHRYQAGDQFWELPAQAESEQEIRYQIDSWEEVIERWLAGCAPASSYPSDLVALIDKTTTSEVMQRALGVEIAKHTRQDQMRVGTILLRLGWVRKQELDPETGRRRRCYVRQAP